MPPPLFPAAARANRSIFYDKHGNARSVAGVYGELTRRYQTARASATPDTGAAIASSAPAVAPACTNTDGHRYRRSHAGAGGGDEHAGCRPNAWFRSFIRCSQPTIGRAPSRRS